MFITGKPGTVKSYVCKELQQESLNKVVDGNCFYLCTPTHKSVLIADATTILIFFNINPVDYTYNKTTVDKLKKVMV